MSVFVFDIFNKSRFFVYAAVCQRHISAQYYSKSYASSRASEREGKVVVVLGQFKSHIDEGVITVLNAYLSQSGDGGNVLRISQSVAYGYFAVVFFSEVSGRIAVEIGRFVVEHACRGKDTRFECGRIAYEWF